ncbi:MAG: hypothetical protein JXR32_01770 [Anaerolineaceae bacterium]|nr:hypothetical protein [Anaerolineaceae bacterium]
MDRKWTVAREIESIDSIIIASDWIGNDLVIKPLRIQASFILYGCYIPARPRPTSIITGRIVIRRISSGRTELRAVGFPEWAEPYIERLRKLTIESTCTVVAN